jgi:N-acetylated-alpha-linked acidic dipeptidase
MTLLPKFSVPLAGMLLLTAAPLLSAQSAPRPLDRLPGFSPANSTQQQQLEREAIGTPNSVRAQAHAKALSAEPHVAGTEAQARTRDYVINEMKRMGLRTEVRAYDVWLPHATSVRAWRLGRDTLELALQEPPIPGDETTAMPQYPTVNGYSAAGTAEGELVFVNFGLIEDYAVLDSLGVSVKGKVVLARYGRSFRGIKAREAEKRGALGLFIYTDPLDDGFARGDVYPQGPMRPITGVQRGSVFNGQGDPTTPGYASTKTAVRVPLEQTAVPRIPVVPLSAQNAELLMRDLRGTDIPAGWQGGLPLRYHIGAGPVRVKMTVETDADTNGVKTIWNTLGILQGSEFPDEYIYIGSHRDGWGAGAADNVSGTVSVLEAAQALSELAKRGERPRRSIVFATWDAEEWGLVGSTEYVEDDSLKLLRGGVAYLNQDVAAQGPSFGAGGSPSLRSTLRSVVSQIPDPRGRGMVYDVWRLNTGTTRADAEPAMGDPGGGSDFAGFYNHLGIPHADWGFSGPAGVYHSAYDTFEWMRTWGDPGFLFHATAARIGAAMALRLANADVHPYDYVEFARTMKGYVPLVSRGLARNGWDSALVQPLAHAIDSMHAAAERFTASRDAQLAVLLPKAVREQTNSALRNVERSLTRPQGLLGRPWWRSLIYAADVDNGYATMSFPGINEAVRARDAARAQSEIDDLTNAFAAATKALVDARSAIMRAN